jgi:hypothetical protein
MRLRWISIATALLFTAGAGARADDLAAFNAALEDFAGHNRVALGYLRTENVDLAAAELDEMQQSWSRFAERFSGRRPDELRDNPLYVTALVDVPTRIVTAMMMLNAGRPQVARTSLQAIRRELADMRRASGIEVLADCVLDANTAMEALGDAPPDWTKPETAGDVAAKADRYGDAVRRCDGLAPADVRSNPEFRRLIDGIAASLAFVPKAIAERDSDLLHRVIIELRSFDNLLAFRYG